MRRSDSNILTETLGFRLRAVISLVIAVAAAHGLAATAAVRRPALSAAFSPDGSKLAIGSHQEVRIASGDTGVEAQTLKGFAGGVVGVAWSPGGETLATCGGVPGSSGEIRLRDSVKGEFRTLSGVHTDVVYGISWSRDGKTLAACGYDHLVSLWDVKTGKGRTLKDHTDAVYAVAFSPDGTLLASASGDRTVKIWDPKSGKRLYTLADSTAELYSLTFSPSGKEIAAGGADKMLRKWSIGPTSGALERSAFAHSGPVLRALFTPDGSGIYTSSQDKSIKLWDAVELQEKQILEKQADWAMGLAISADGKRLAAARYDGSVALYDTETGVRINVSKP